jgi:flagellar hook-basal body complex protein FliE
MQDPLGLIGNASGMQGIRPSAYAPAKTTQAEGTPDFLELLKSELSTVNELQKDASRAAEELMAGRRDDVETVMAATAKADMAFQMLMQVRNKVLDAYQEIKQIRA